MTVTVDDTKLKDIADAIRAKNGTKETYKPSEMASAIEAIPRGGLKCVKGTDSCNLTCEFGILTITGIPVSNLKYLRLYYHNIIDHNTADMNYFDFDFDIVNQKYDSYFIMCSSGVANIRSNINRNATITINESSNTITINLNMAGVSIKNSTAGNSVGWFYKAFYEL